MPDKRAKYYHIVTFGCQMNENDSEKIAGALEAKGYRLVKNKDEADLIIINSCSVRESAENRVFGLINNINKRKRQNAKGKITTKNIKIIKPKIIITGCMVGSGLGERKRYTLKQLKKKLPGIKILPLNKLLKNSKEPAKRKKKKSALVQIMFGCDNFCSYCVVPYARGREISRPFEEIICEVENLVKKGYEEIMLLGQNVNSYKNAKRKAQSARLQSEIKNYRKKYKTDFAILLALLNEIEGLKKIKFMTSNPWDLTDGIIEAMKLPKIDRYLHLPVQSGDDEILKKMNRRYSAKQYLNLIRKIKKKIPDIKIGTDIIVGFPGETEKQFENTVDLCKKAGFEIAYISKYSSRPGTAAAKAYEDNVPMKEKKQRWQVLEKMINRNPKS